MMPQVLSYPSWIVAVVQIVIPDLCPCIRRRPRKRSGMAGIVKLTPISRAAKRTLYAHISPPLTQQIETSQSSKNIRPILMQIMLGTGALFIHQPAPAAEPIQAEARGGGMRAICGQKMCKAMARSRHGLKATIAPARV
jgi:hypothetical protein